ncbi:MAG: hypothetical protein JNJ88_05785 [Planctomycetes bacterium]|nr:hypothetical protein [Planctomycetota bacterium]
MKHPLQKAAVRAAVTAAVVRCHRRIVRDVRSHIAPLLARGDYESAMAIHGPGAGDITYRVDAVADAAVEELAERLGRIAPVRVLCEGPGEIVAGGGEPQIRVLVDPIDGTRNWMADLRSAWVLTGVAAEREDRVPTTRDLLLSVQTEIPPSDRVHGSVWIAQRSRGVRVGKFKLARSGSSAPRLERARTSKNPDVRSGYYSFLRYLPSERAAIGRLEVEFFRKAQKAVGLVPERTYDDQWLCAAGQLMGVALGRTRMFADLRAWLAAAAGTSTVASHPYDLCALLVATEAGAVVVAPSVEERWRDLEVPLDLETPVSCVAFASNAIRKHLEPVLREVLRECYSSVRANGDLTTRRSPAKRNARR